MRYAQNTTVGADRSRLVPQDPPKTIYLQWHCEEHDSDWGNPSPGDITWCPDQIFSDDLVYKLVER